MKRHTFTAPLMPMPTIDTGINSFGIDWQFVDFARLPL